ncbi:MAG: tetratricopeptide repeat protein [Acidobacteria bacterium]|nr:tetratricopeptide repeat protein [Acidobacteriota bacterium]
MNGPFVPSTLAEIFRDLFLTERSGILSLSRTGVRKRVYFDRGMIFFADSSLEDEGLIDFLVHARTLGAQDLPGIRGARGDDRALAQWLFDSGKVPLEKLQQSVREQIQQVVVSTFRWDSGESAFQDTPPGGGEAFCTNVILTFEFLMRGIRSMSGFGPIREAMHRLDRKLKLSENLYLPLDKLALHPIQGFVLSRIDGSSSIGEIASLIPPSDEDNALRFLFGLLILGVVEISPPLGTGPLVVRNLLTGDREERERGEREAAIIKEMCRALSSGTSWEALGIAAGADTETTRKAYESRRDAFRPGRFVKKVQEVYRDELMLIEGKLLEAYLAFSQNQMQSARQGSAHGGSMKLDIDSLSMRKELSKTQNQELLEEQVRRAEHFFSKAREYFKAKDYHNAIQYCEQALKGNDADARYHFLLGQVLVRNPDYRWQKRAEQSLLRAAEIDPWNVEHFVHLGNFYRAHNLLRKAKKSYLKAVEMMPSHSEAQKALSEMKRVDT